MDERQELIEKIEGLLGELNEEEILAGAKDDVVNAFYNICMEVAKGDGETISFEDIVDPVTRAIKMRSDYEELSSDQVEHMVVELIKYFVMNDNLVYVFRAEDVQPTLAMNKRPEVVEFGEHVERMKAIDKAGGIKFRKDGMVN